MQRSQFVEKERILKVSLSFGAGVVVEEAPGASAGVEVMRHIGRRA